MNVPLIQIAGTDVRPSISPMTARIAFPSSSLSSSTAVYFAPFSSSNCFALQHHNVDRLYRMMV